MEDDSIPDELHRAILALEGDQSTHPRCLVDGRLAAIASTVPEPGLRAIDALDSGDTGLQDARSSAFRASSHELASARREPVPTAQRVRRGRVEQRQDWDVLSLGL